MWQRRLLICNSQKTHIECLNSLFWGKMLSLAAFRRAFENKVIFLTKAEPEMLSFNIQQQKGFNVTGLGSLASIKQPPHYIQSENNIAVNQLEQRSYFQYSLKQTNSGPLVNFVF